MVIRRVRPLSAAKVCAAVYAVIGLLIGAIITLIGFAGGFGAATAGMPFSSMFGIGAIIILPIVYGCIGFIAMLLISSDGGSREQLAPGAQRRGENPLKGNLSLNK